LRSFGPDHDKSFEVAAMVREKQLATGSGKTKKLASQEAAKNSLKYLENLGEDLF
jgi:ribonuclease-3